MARVNNKKDSKKIGKFDFKDKKVLITIITVVLTAFLLIGLWFLKSKEDNAKSGFSIVGTDSKIEVTGLKIETASVSLEVEGEAQLNIVVEPLEATDKSLSFVSTDGNIALVDASGKIKGVDTGNCQIKVTSNSNNSIVGEVEVEVKAKAPAVVNSGGLTYINGMLVVNKSYALPASYNPGASSEAMNSFYAMQSAAANDGISLFIVSGFRSYNTQASLYNGYVASYGQAAADTFSARPGHSEHQSGLAFDINAADSSFAGTPEAVWLANNSYKFGFIIRYPQGKESITGYMYEPWHIRYIGVGNASAVYSSGLTLEEYWGIDSSYK